jgi:osmoprotectant transport system substrate-binding protein
MRISRWRVFAVALVGAFALAGCSGSSDAFDEDSPAAPGASGSSGSAARGPVTVGGANFTEMLVMQQLYGQLLADAGWTVDYKTADNREIYAQSLESGEIDVVPEYAATMAEFLNRAENGPDAETVATNDPAATVEAMRPLAEARGLTVLEPSPAADQNGFAVTQEFAQQNSVTTLSQLAARGEPVRLAAVEECADRPFCQPGLEQTYGLEISEVLPLGFGSPQAKQAVLDGDADLVLVGTTDGTLDAQGLVLLEDDKTLQLADNLVPVVNTASAQGVAEVLDPLSQALTTEDLARMNAQVDAERRKAEDVAREYLESKGLL